MSFSFTITNQNDLTSFLQKGGDINQQNYLGQTILHKFVIDNNLSMVKLLLANGAKPYIKDINGKNPSFYSMTDEIAYELFKNGAILDTNNQHCRNIKINILKSQMR